MADPCWVNDDCGSGDWQADDCGTTAKWGGTQDLTTSIVDLAIVDYAVVDNPRDPVLWAQDGVAEAEICPGGGFDDGFDRGFD